MKALSLFLICTALALPPHSATAQDITLGDLNCDGSVNATDAQLSILIAIGAFPSWLDADNNGVPDTCDDLLTPLCDDVCETSASAPMIQTYSISNGITTTETHDFCAMSSFNVINLFATCMAHELWTSVSRNADGTWQINCSSVPVNECTNGPADAAASGPFVSCSADCFNFK